MTTRVLVDGVAVVVKTWAAEKDLRPPVALLPATAETADDWDAVAAALARTRTVHAVDLRGHGGSDWPGVYSVALMAADVAGLLTRLSAQQIDLIAHSLGGLVACDVAAAYPNLIRRLVLEDIRLLHVLRNRLGSACTVLEPRSPMPPLGSNRTVLLAHECRPGIGRSTDREHIRLISRSPFEQTRCTRSGAFAILHGGAPSEP